MSFALRDYQETACDAVEQEWLFNGVRSTMLEMATGLGKTECFVELGRRCQDTRTLVVCPMNTLISQAAAKFYKRTGVMPDIEQAELWANETKWARSQFVVASKQTLTKERKNGFRYERFEDIGLVVVDECHLSITKPYEKMLRYFMDRGANVVGVTATAERLDKRSMKNLYESCAYQYGITEAIPDGWLVGCETNCVQIQSMDLSEVTTRAGDFSQEELNKILEQEKVMLEIADVTVKESGDLKTAVYCSSVAEAKGVAEIIADRYGRKAAFICADKQLCSDQRRKEVLDSFTKDEHGIQFVCNVGVLTTGWDFPALMHIVMARPTKSIALYTQVFGRGTRPLEGTVDFEGSTPDLRRAAIAGSPKPKFRMTDLVDNSLEHKICTSADVMGGRMGIEVIARVKAELVGKGAPVDLDEALKNAKQKLEEEREEAERQRRAVVRGETRYSKTQVDNFDPYQRGTNVKKGRVPAMLFGKHKGKPLNQIPLGYLKWVARECKVKPWFKAAVESEINNRLGIAS
jgi:superfamily II DNA or RNA helicase